jgi:amidase
MRSVAVGDTRRVLASTGEPRLHGAAEPSFAGAPPREPPPPPPPPPPAAAAAASSSLSSIFCSLFAGWGGRLGRAGAKVMNSHPRLPDIAAGHQAYAAMLNTIITRGAPTAPAPMDAHAWMNALDVQAAAGRAWAALFEEVDVVLAPPFGVAAFPHDDRPNLFTHTLTINGQETPYLAQVAWAGMATYPGLPSTCVPVGRTASGLPVGVQIIGPYLEDRTTIALAGLIERGF